MSRKHLKHLSPFCETCPACLWHLINQIEEQRDVHLGALKLIANQGCQIKAIRHLLPESIPCPCLGCMAARALPE